MVFTRASNRRGDLLAAFLLLAVVQMAASQLVLTGWVDGLAAVRLLALLGSLLGLALGLSQFSAPLMAALTLIYGVVAVFWRAGLFLGNEISWDERLATVVSHLSVSFAQLARGDEVTSEMFILVWMMALCWGVGVFAGMALWRFENPWWSLLPGGLLALLVYRAIAAVQPQSQYLVAYLFFGLLVVARRSFRSRAADWQQRRLHVPLEMGGDVFIVTLGVTLGLLAVSWNVPTPARSSLAAKRAWARLTIPLDPLEDRFRRAFAPARGGIRFEVLRSAYYGEVLPLGRSTPDDEDVVFIVEAPVPPFGARYYWRARQYDYYADGVWRNTLTTRALLAPDGAGLPASGQRVHLSTTVVIMPRLSLLTLFTPPQPEWVSLPAEVELAFNVDGSVDVGAFHAQQPVSSGGAYVARGSLSTPTVEQLRAAGEAYPPWVVERYLQLPSSITLRTRQLARQIAGDAPTPYDAVEEVTSYLRSHLTYQPVLPFAPLDQEPLDWILFDLQQGFCNYYASAEVILLRSLGIPARLVVGYAQGEFQPVEEVARGLPQSGSNEMEGRYVVRQRDAHAWPEVYFPEIGWVEFEPTISQQPFNRPEQRLLEDNPGFDGGDTPALGQPDEKAQALLQQYGWKHGAARKAVSPTQPSWPGWLLAALLLALLILWLSPGRDVRLLPALLLSGLQRSSIHLPRFLTRWARMRTLKPIQRAYNEINRSLERLAGKPSLGATPAERAERLKIILPDTASHIDRLVDIYQSAVYAEVQVVDLRAAFDASREIRRAVYKAQLRRTFTREEGEHHERR